MAGEFHGPLVCSFCDIGLTVCYYDSGQPSLLSSDVKYVDLVATGLWADGHKEDPVVFTNDFSVPAAVGSKYRHHIEPMRHNGAPTHQMVLKYFDLIRLRESRAKVLGTDNAGDLNHSKVEDELDSFGIHHWTPPPVIAWAFNPCDTNFHSALKQRYFSEPRLDHNSSLEALLEAYHSQKDSTIVSYFKKCQIHPQSVPSKAKLQQLLEASYRPSGSHASFHAQCEELYLGWKKNVRFLRARHGQPVRSELLECQLDGSYWITT